MAVTFPYRTVKDVDVRDRQILLRADYNVPLRDDGSIADDYRLVASLPTLRYLLERGAGIVIIWGGQSQSKIRSIVLRRWLSGWLSC